MAKVARAHSDHQWRWDRELGTRGITSNVIAPGYVAAAVEYLASPAAGYTTGAVLHVNGGAYVSS